MFLCQVCSAVRVRTKRGTTKHNMHSMGCVKTAQAVMGRLFKRRRRFNVLVPGVQRGACAHKARNNQARHAQHGVRKNRASGFGTKLLYHTPIPNRPIVIY